MGDASRPGRGPGQALGIPGTTRLAAACLDRARQDGRRRLVLHTATYMPAAVRLYERLGFARLPERDFSPVPNVDLIAYAFELETR